jgi:hypothetical protein
MMFGTDADKREEEKIKKERDAGDFDTERQKDYSQKVEKRKYDLTKQHYRRFYEDELENSSELKGGSPFIKENLLRGQSRGNSKSFFGSLFSSDREDASGEITTEKNVGYLKAMIEVFNKEDRDKFVKESNEIKN